MAQQTAVEQLEKKLKTYFLSWSSFLEEDFEQAKAMERQQIVDAFYEGMQANTFDPNKGRALIYYNETYNQ